MTCISVFLPKVFRVQGHKFVYLHASSTLGTICSCTFLMQIFEKKNLFQSRLKTGLFCTQVEKFSWGSPRPPGVLLDASENSSRQIPELIISSFQLQSFQCCLRSGVSIKNSKKKKPNGRWLDVLVQCPPWCESDVKGSSGKIPDWKSEVANGKRRKRHVSLAHEGWLGNFHTSSFFAALNGP